MTPFQSIRWKADLKPGDVWRERGRTSRVERVGAMWAMVYYGAGDVAVTRNRPYFCTEHDILARVAFVHRCGTDVKLRRSGRAVPLDASLLEELKDLLGLQGEYDPEQFKAYTRRLFGAPSDPPASDPLYLTLSAWLDALPAEETRALAARLRREWGRVLGHEMTVVVEHVGAKVHTLTKPIGYAAGEERLPAEYLNFQPGERLTVQTRVARYALPPAHLRGPGVRGVQLLNQDYQNMAMELDAAYAEYVRLTPEMIQSRSLLRLPSSLSDAAGAMVEPAACLLDCLDRGAHPEAQGPSGNLLKKGVKRGGCVGVIGSGAMAFMAAQFALLDDPVIQVGGAARVVMLVRSQAKADLGRRLFPDEPRLDFLVNPPGASHEDIVRSMKERYGADFGFDDVIVAAGDADTLALAHKLTARSNWSVHAFAGARGPVAIDAGVWHYGAAATHGTSGCNTKAMENVIGLAERGFDLEKFSGRVYSLQELENDVSPFFEDAHLRPALRPGQE